MTTHGSSNPRQPNGQPLDPALEADLLAWIEGEPLPAARDAAVAKHLNGHPRAAERLLRMKLDREALRAMADEPAPAWLVQGALAALEPVLERQMLLDLSEGEPVGNGPPVSIVRPPRQSLWETFTADRLGRRLAMAAALLLMVGGVTYLAAGRFGGSPGGPTLEEGGRLALELPDDEAPTILNQEERPTEIAAAPEVMMKSGAAGDEPIDEPAATMMAHADEGTRTEAGTVAASATGDDPMALAAAPEATEPVEIGPERALELAREGRLAIRVVTRNPERAVARLDSRAARRSASAPWRLGGEVGETIIAALANPGPSTALVRADLPPEDLRPAFAGSDLPPEVRMLLPAPEATFLAIELPSPASAVPTARMAEVRLDERTLESVRKEAGRVAAGRAVYEELPASLPEETPPVNPASVFWWAQPPSAWGGWGRVPVIIEAR